MKLSTVAILVLIVGTILIIVAPYLFTRTSGAISFNDTGEIGDTIGGITAPITGLVGSILVYLALKAQIKANEIIQEQVNSQAIEIRERRQFELLSELYKNIDKNIEYLEYNKMRGNAAIKDVLYTLSQGNRKSAHLGDLSSMGKLAAIDSIFSLEIYFLEKLNDTKLNPDDRKYFMDLIKLQLEQFVYPALNLINEKPACEMCGETHNGFPFQLENTILKINDLLTAK